MKSILRFLRVPEWYDSKIPMLLSAPLYFYVLDAPEPRRAALFLLVFFVFLFTYLAFGYVVNDFSDMEADRRAGKKKLITGISRPWVAAIIALLILAGAAPLCFFSQFDWKAALILLLNYLLGASYSLKPLRFKERGIAGLIVSSAAQRCTPLLVLPFLWSIPPLLFIGWEALSFLAGLRYILIHQYKDYEADVSSGVRTFATKHKKASALGVYICFGAEALTTLLLAVPLALRYWWFIAAPVLYALLALLAGYAVRRLMQQPFFLGFTYVPLEDFFNVLLPLTLAAIWTWQTRSVWPVAALVLLLLYLLPTIRGKTALMALPIRVKILGLKPDQEGGD